VRGAHAAGVQTGSAHSTTSNRPLLLVGVKLVLYGD
jgi:hypothetical protein